jgi:hypothetical protein
MSKQFKKNIVFIFSNGFMQCSLVFWFIFDPFIIKDIGRFSVAKILIKQIR